MAKNLVNTFFTGNLHKFYKKTGKKSMEEFIHGLQHLVWGPGMLVFFLGTGIRFTLRSRFFQIRKIHIWMRMTIGALLNRKDVRRTDKEHSIPSSSLSVQHWQLLLEREILQECLLH